MVKIFFKECKEQFFESSNKFDPDKENFKTCFTKNINNNIKDRNQRLKAQELIKKVLKEEKI